MMCVKSVEELANLLSSTSVIQHDVCKGFDAVGMERCYAGPQLGLRSI